MQISKDVITIQAFVLAYYSPLYLHKFFKWLFCYFNWQPVFVVNNSCKNHMDKQQRGKAGSCLDQDQQYKITLKIDGNADSTTKGW